MTEATKVQVGKFTLKDVRMSFPNLFEAKAPSTPGAKAKYSAAFLFGKNHPQLDELRKLIGDVAAAKWGAKAPDVLVALKASDKLCVHDGDAKSDTDGYAGNLFINASNDVRPLALGGGPDGRAPVTAADGKLYAGCYVNAIIQVWAQDNQFGKRVNASLLGVQFLRDGTRLAGGGTAAADDFEPIATNDQAKAASAGTGAAALF
jgi:hypothetical protein